MTNNVEGCIEKHDEGGRGALKMPQNTEYAGREITAESAVALRT